MVSSHNVKSHIYKGLCRHPYSKHTEFSLMKYGLFLLYDVYIHLILLIYIVNIYSDSFNISFNYFYCIMQQFLIFPQLYSQGYLRLIK